MTKTDMIAQMDILLVEDNADMQTLLREMLEFGGHRVWIGRTGLEALQTLESAPQPPHLIISDLTMPRMSGVDLLQAVRQNPLLSRVRFVIMSANTQDERLTAEVLAQLDGVLPKPFFLRDLEAILAS